MIFNKVSVAKKKSFEYIEPKNFNLMSASFNNNLIIDSLSSSSSVTKGSKSKTKDNLLNPSIKKDPIIPNYKILRVDEIIEGFNQASIYCTIYGDYNQAGLISLNRSIAKNYSNFSNLIICLYSGNDLDATMANGGSNRISIKDKRENWISMYSFNKVEGEYFDDRPTSYHEVN